MTLSVIIFIFPKKEPEHIDRIDRIDAERDYIRLFVGERSFLLHHTMGALEARLDPARFIRLHRSCIAQRRNVARLRHDGVGVWTAVLNDGTEQRISRSALARAKQLLARF